MPIGIASSNWNSVELLSKIFGILVEEARRAADGQGRESDDDDDDDDDDDGDDEDDGTGFLQRGGEELVQLKELVERCKGTWVAVNDDLDHFVENHLK